MPLDHPPASDLQAQTDTLNAEMRHHSGTQVLRRALREIPRLALVSSFGAESVALLHLAAQVKPDIKVLFIDTMMLFPETLQYQREVARQFGLRRVQVIRAQDTNTDADGTLHKTDPDACCALRKTSPLAAAIKGYDGWITGRKRFQSGTRTALPFFEVETGSERLKVNPLAHWTPQDVTDYISNNNLPRHPLVAQGFPSLGCAPCTTSVRADEDPRAGRWRDTKKQECGIHFVNGKMVQQGDKT